LTGDFGIQRNNCTLSLMDDQYYRKERPKRSISSWLGKKWKNKNLRLTLLIVIPVFSFITFSNKGVLQRLHIESEKRIMQEKIQQAHQEQLKLQEQSKALDNDPKAIEKVAREKYGMIREGETVYKIKKGK
jgi:cell division protein FtsB